MTAIQRQLLAAARREATGKCRPHRILMLLKALCGPKNEWHNRGR